MIGWGWEPRRASTFGHDYLDYLQWLGMGDAAAYLAVPDAIQFQADHDWPSPPCRLKPIWVRSKAGCWSSAGSGIPVYSGESVSLFACRFRLATRHKTSMFWLRPWPRYSIAVSRRRQLVN